MQGCSPSFHSIELLRNFRAGSPATFVDVPSILSSILSGGGDVSWAQYRRFRRLAAALMVWNKSRRQWRLKVGFTGTSAAREMTSHEPALYGSSKAATKPCGSSAVPPQMAESAFATLDASGKVSQRGFPSGVVRNSTVGPARFLGAKAQAASRASKAALSETLKARLAPCRRPKWRLC